MNRVQDLGVVVDTEGSHHLALVLFKLLLILNLQRKAAGCHLRHSLRAIDNKYNFSKLTSLAMLV